MIQESSTNYTRKAVYSSRGFSNYVKLTFANLSSNMYKAKLLYMYARLRTNNHMLT